MAINPALPDYDLADLIIVSRPAELRAMGDGLRSTLLDLLLERAATVSELALAVGRPKSTIAHHVKVLLNAGLLRVVRTRRVRAIDERFYGRTARIFYVGPLNQPGDPWAPDFMDNYLSTAAAESAKAHEDDHLRAILRHARIPNSLAREFWEKVFELTREFSALPRSGDTVFGFVAGLYPTDYPSLPEPDGSQSVGGSLEPDGSRPDEAGVAREGTRPVKAGVVASARAAGRKTAKQSAGKAAGKSAGTSAQTSARTSGGAKP